MSHERKGESNEWYTPKYIFDALNTVFDIDVAAPKDRTYLHVPANHFITENGLGEWNGYVWMNPPFGDMKTKFQWIDRFILNGNGIILMPDRSPAPWWQYLAERTEAVILLKGKVKFIRQDGTIGKSPSNGTCLFSLGSKGRKALLEAENNGLGKLYFNRKIKHQ